jgi:hypothetical protein
LVLRGKPVDIAGRDEVDVLRATAIKPEQQAPGQNRTAERQADHEIDRDTAGFHARVQQVTYEVEHHVGEIDDGGSAGTGLPVDDAQLVVVDQQMLGLEIPVQMDDRMGLKRLECLCQGCPPRSQSAARRELVEQEMVLERRVPSFIGPAGTRCEPG